MAAQHTFDVPRLKSPLTLDGKLDEECYRIFEPYTEFVYPWEPEHTPPPTKAWLFWDDTYLYSCWDVDDDHFITAPPGPDGKLAVLDHSRVEIFLWNGDPKGSYYGFEINPHGLTLDYEARFHRIFNRDWTCHGLKIGSSRTERGYCIEAAIPLDTLAASGYDLRSQWMWRAGLYRAEKDAENPEEFHWSCIVNPHREEVDFHIPETFGILALHPTDKPMARPDEPEEQEHEI